MNRKKLTKNQTNKKEILSSDLSDWSTVVNFMQQLLKKEEYLDYNKKILANFYPKRLTIHLRSVYLLSCRNNGQQKMMIEPGIVLTHLPKISAT